MIIQLKNGLEIGNAKYFRTIFDVPLARFRHFVFGENEDGEILRIEIPTEDLSDFFIKEDGETRFDIFG